MSSIVGEATRDLEVWFPTRIWSHLPWKKLKLVCAFFALQATHTKNSHRDFFFVPSRYFLFFPQQKQKKANLPKDVRCSKESTTSVHFLFNWIQRCSVSKWIWFRYVNLLQETHEHKNCSISFQIETRDEMNTSLGGENHFGTLAGEYCVEKLSEVQRLNFCFEINKYLLS